ncbi:hypothetical protein BY996DRAFT_7868267, partial [Phakopsora pachyrhizi]
LYHSNSISHLIGVVLAFYFLISIFYLICLVGNLLQAYNFQHFFFLSNFFDLSLLLYFAFKILNLV